MISPRSLLIRPALAVLILWLIVVLVSISGGLPEPWGTIVGQNLSRAGHFTFLAVSLSALIFGPLRTGETRLTRLLMLGGALVGYLLVVEGLKAVIWLPRPDDYLHGTHTRGSGFPSGHTVPAFAVACLVAATSPKWAWPALAMAIAIGYARVEVTAHFAYQVVASALFGCAIGTAMTMWREARARKN